MSFKFSSIESVILVNIKIAGAQIKKTNCDLVHDFAFRSGQNEITKSMPSSVFTLTAHTRLLRDIFFNIL